MRVAKILVRRTGIPVYVGCSAVFGGMGFEEEMAGVKGAVEGVIGVLKEKGERGGRGLNGGCDCSEIIY